MKTNSKYLPAVVLLVTLALVLAACAPDDGERETLNQFESEVSAITLEPSEPLPTATSTPIPPQIETDTPTPSPTSTVPPTPTDTPAPLPTDTVVPPPTEAPPAEPTESSDSSEAAPTESTETSEGSGSAEGTPTEAVDSTEDSEASEPAGEDALDPGSNPANWDKAERPDSYQAKTDVVYKGLDETGAEIRGSFFFETQFMREPQRASLLLGGDMPIISDLGLQEDDILRTFFVDDLFYTKPGETEFIMPVEESGFDVEAMTFNAIDGLLQELESAEYQGPTNVGGLAAKIWFIDVTHFVLESPGPGEVQDASGFLVTLDEAQFVVEGGLVITGTLIEVPSGLLQTGTMTTSFEVVDINQPFLFDWLPPANEPTIQSLPTPDDAEDILTGLATQQYRSPSIPAEIAAFYLKSMDELGWGGAKEQVGNEPIPITWLRFAKDGETIRIRIQDHPAEKQSYVHITVEP